MKIEHLAIWTNDLERLRSFYGRYFGVTAGPKYRNEVKAFESYFLAFSEGARLEIMHCPNLQPVNAANYTGLAHFAISVGSKENVIANTEQLRKDGFCITGEPRVTGDGYFESIVLDPDGNRVEITI